MLKRIIAATFVSGMLLVSAPHAALADGRRGGDDRRSGHNDNRRDRDRGHDRHNRGHDRGYDGHRGHDRGRDRNDYSRRYGYDRGYYGYYGSGCDGYRDGYYYSSDGRRYSRGDGSPYYRRNADCDNYYNQNGRYYGSPSCNRYDSRSGYCG